MSTPSPTSSPPAPASAPPPATPATPPSTSPPPPATTSAPPPTSPPPSPANPSPSPPSASPPPSSPSGSSPPPPVTPSALYASVVGKRSAGCHRRRHITSELRRRPHREGKLTDTVSTGNRVLQLQQIMLSNSGGKRLLVYEYVPNNTLEFHLHGRGRPTMEWPTRLRIALSSAKGLAYLHEDCHPKIIHRDIKAANILLDYKFVAKVADFGLAKSASDNNTHVSTRVMGTFGYLAPEYASSGKLTDKSDVFSFGVMLLELITGRRPVDSSQTFMDDSLVDWARPLLTRALDDGNYDALVDRKLGMNYNPNEMACMIACAAACVRHSSRRRPRMSQILRALEGDVSLEDLNEGIRPGHSRFYSSYGSSDYDSSQYNEDMKKFRKMALTTQEYASSEYSAPTSEYGQNPSASSSEGAHTQEVEMGKKKDSYNYGSSL
ncbi:hypothetical protein OPV22_023444 [Ensete ventricosum]|uniref:non-specific serine/threonine protein kinase n=1 Tax=Ensete ventricosum TaxID=4639 RepID=A0AAV8QSX1_ENSVE|nr:hypothetical protein OPV22_023444 [Ensete ventricosum]